MPFRDLLHPPADGLLPSGIVIFTDLANNTIGVLDVVTGEFGQFVGVGQAPYSLDLAAVLDGEADRVGA